MPTLTYDDDELGLSPGWDEGLDPNIRRELKQARVDRKERDDLKVKVDAYERERTLARAGIPQDKRGELFARTYEGDLNDPAAVKAAYTELFGEVTPGEPAGAAEGDPAAGDRRVAQATAAGESLGVSGAIPFEDALRAAKTKDEVLELIRNAPESARSQDGYRMRLSED